MSHPGHRPVLDELGPDIAPEIFAEFDEQRILTPAESTSRFTRTLVTRHMRG